LRRAIKIALLCTTALFPVSACADPVTGIIVGAAAASIGGASFLGLTGVSAFFARAAIGLAGHALSPKPQLPGGASSIGYQVGQTGAAVERQYIYGRTMVNGVRAFDHTTGGKNKFLHRILVFAAHEIESFEEIYVDGNLVTLNEDGEITSPKAYENRIVIKTHLGADDQAADADLMAVTDKWTADHRLRGCAYMYVYLEHRPSKFPHGVPQIKAVIKGKKVYDPRTGLTAWSDNPALCLNDHIINDEVGLKATQDGVSTAHLIAAANICDETVNDRKRYTCNGSFLASVPRGQVAKEIAGSMGGDFWHSQGTWKMDAAVWNAPTLSIGPDDFIAPIEVDPGGGAVEAFNMINGVFRGEETSYELTDYPMVPDATERQALIAQDGGIEAKKDFPLPFTDTAEMARDLARIKLEENWGQVSFTTTLMLRAWQAEHRDIVSVTLDYMGWSDKTFRIHNPKLVLSNGSLGVEATFTEVVESVYDRVDDGVVYAQDNTDLIDPFEVVGVSLSAQPLARVFQERLVNALEITVSSTGANSINGVEVEYKLSSSEVWLQTPASQLGTVEINDIEPGEYDIRARALNLFDVPNSEYATITGLTVDALSGAPDDVAGFDFEVVGNQINLSWDRIANLDLSHCRIRYSPVETGAAWASATTVAERVSRPGTTATVPFRSGTYLIAAYNKSGTRSANVTSVVVPSSYAPSYATTLSQTEDPGFAGTKSGVSVASNLLRLTAPVAIDASGEYEFSNYIDTGSVRRAWLYVRAVSSRISDGGDTWDSLPGLWDDLQGPWDSLGAVGDLDDTNIEFWYSATDDDPSGSPTWGAWRRFKAADVPGRAFKFKVVLRSETPEVTPAISALTAYVEY